MAECQATVKGLTHRHRRQASSHIGSAFLQVAPSHSPLPIQAPGYRPQRQAAHRHEQQEGDPQPVVAQPLQGPGNRQYQHHRQQHPIAHFPRPRCTDKQPIEQITPHCNQRQYREVGQVDIGGFAHAGDIGLHGDEQMAAEGEQQGETHAGDQRPTTGNHQ